MIETWIGSSHKFPKFGKSQPIIGLKLHRLLLFAITIRVEFVERGETVVDRIDITVNAPIAASRTAEIANDIPS
jgi:hypothetical protein